MAPDGQKVWTDRWTIPPTSSEYNDEEFKTHLKIKALECSQHYSYYKYMEFFLDAKGQLTP